MVSNLLMRRGKPIKWPAVSFNFCTVPLYSKAIPSMFPEPSESIVAVLTSPSQLEVFISTMSDTGRQSMTDNIKGAVKVCFILSVLIAALWYTYPFGLARLSEKYDRTSG
jgi:hypothetical protein